MPVKHNVKCILLHEDNSVKNQMAKAGKCHLIFSSLVKHMFLPQQKARFTGMKKWVFASGTVLKCRKTFSFWWQWQLLKTHWLHFLWIDAGFTYSHDISGPLLIQLRISWVALDKIGDCSTKITTSLTNRSDHMEKCMTWALSMWSSLITLMSSLLGPTFKARALQYLEFFYFTVPIYIF